MGATHVLLDFFGTVVEVGPGDDDYPHSYQLVRQMGTRLDREQFGRAWDATWHLLSERSKQDHREFSVAAAAECFLREALGREPAEDEVRQLAETHSLEWNQRVHYRPEVISAVRRLARDYPIAVVSNTNDSYLVPDHLDRTGLTGAVAAVVLSVEVGWRKPHPHIYAVALERLGVSAEQTVFAGDSYLNDYMGPQAVGIRSYLIDPESAHPVPGEHRIASLADLPDRLASSPPQDRVDHDGGAP